MVDECKNPLFPNCIETKDRQINEIIDEATTILIKDFSLGEVKFRGKTVRAQYPYTDKFSYEHILKLDEPNLPESIKIQRCKYAPKFKILLEEIENKTCPNFKHWKEFNSKKSQWRHIILCEKERLVIILKEIKKSEFLLITSYYANYPNYIKSLLKQYNNADEKNKLK